MPSATLNLIGEQIIEQGSYWELTLRYPGNVEGGRLKGQIRKDFKEELLATFRFNTGTYEADQNKTAFKMYLRAQESEEIPVPPQGVFWLYDVLFIPPEKNDPIRILQGYVNVSPGVTEV